MLLLTAGLVLFLLPHSLRELGLRGRAMAAMPSPRAYRGLFALVSLAGIALIAAGKARAPFVEVWVPPFEWRTASIFVSLPASVLVLAGVLGENHFRLWLRHPMLLGVLLWGLSHLWSNGDAASMLLFGGFAVWAAIKYAARFRDGPADVEPRPMRSLLVLVSGGALFMALVIYHGRLFGVGLVVDV